jgi:hypothetical protein
VRFVRPSAGILTDSGSFKFPGTTGNTHRIVELIEVLKIQIFQPYFLKIALIIDYNYWEEHYKT